MGKERQGWPRWLAQSAGPGLTGAGRIAG